MKAAHITSCPERDMCVNLLLDEMHIRQDVVFDKHSGHIIGFANLGEKITILSILSGKQ